MANLTKLEIEEISKGLKKLKPGFLPLSVFEQTARLTVTPIVEIVPIRKSLSGTIEVLLFKRNSNDLWWPDQLHIPGTVVRAEDKEGSFDDALNRLLHEEMKGVEFADTPQFIKHLFRKTKRGMEVVFMYYIEVSENKGHGMFFPLDKLPKQLVEETDSYISQALSGNGSANISA